MPLNRIDRAAAILDMGREQPREQFNAYAVVLPAGQYAGHGTICSGCASVLELPFEIVDAKNPELPTRPTLMLAMTGGLANAADFAAFMIQVADRAEGSIVVIPVDERIGVLAVHEAIQLTGVLSTFRLP